ncbi:hypothetical protein [Mucilaginibacter gotjawali]|uniref:Uncharacterized protein n=1 Tax=Mucilaginibacter gotjawali TaxID=1550579 RepID=A0A839SBY2_9SPHI|nr:hypothetical protein [Mucilaginibacter gotjawali]MBB3054420.1 hypothetical protein [Mucilaginibacter gotjawali]
MSILLITAAYLDFFCGTVNIYTIVIKQSCLLLVYISPIVYYMITKDKQQRWWAVFGCIWVVTISLRTKNEIHDYNETVCKAKFGKTFNQQRRNRGIAVIPQDWQITSSLGSEIDWKGKDQIIGHTDKSVYIDSACEDAFERDNYELKPIRGISRWISIGRVVTKGKGADTDSYAFEFGANSRNITRQQADSILASEKITKDY